MSCQRCITILPPHHDLNLMLAFRGNTAFVEGFENY
jgi:hypothetical protein